MAYLLRRFEYRKWNQSKKEMYFVGNKAGGAEPSLTFGMELQDLEFGLQVSEVVSVWA